MWKIWIAKIVMVLVRDCSVGFTWGSASGTAKGLFGVGSLIAIAVILKILLSR
jgi:hypothetical protein